MELTKGEFCQFSLTARFELVKEFGNSVVKKKIGTRLVSIYRLFDFYVEVSESPSGHCPEKIEPLPHARLLDIYKRIWE